MADELNKIIQVPDIGTDDEVTVIEVNVAIGDNVSEEDALITLESEKASMEVPCPYNGIVKNVLVKAGDKVKQGSDIIVLDLILDGNLKTDSIEESTVAELSSASSKYTIQNSSENHSQNLSQNPSQSSEQSTNIISKKSNNTSNTIEVLVPDIGTDVRVDIIEINVKPGDIIEQEDALITLESEKASMEVPSPYAGVVKELKVSVGDKVAKGDLVLYLDVVSDINNIDIIDTRSDMISDLQANNIINKPINIESSVESSAKKLEQTSFKTQPVNISTNISNSFIYASPSIRRFANELGVDLARVIGTGRKGRIVKTDIEQYVKTELAKTQAGVFSSISSNNNISEDFVVIDNPKVDFAKFGNIEVKPFNRIKKLTASNLHRNWVMVPHVTQFDEADITDLESFRQKHKQQAQDHGYKLTPLVFIMKAVVQALKAMPGFNVSIVKSKEDGELNLVYKNYYHIGVAVDTPNGLVVPVIRDVDRKGLFQLAKELGELSLKARDGKLTASDMQGGCFTISSLGGIGGTAFTPIVNMPEVAILGVSKSQYKPVYMNKEFVPRLMLPLCLSYDHRAIDGADGARFISKLSYFLSDITQLLL